MAQWSQVAYQYDGSFEGFLTCVFESFVHREAPACFFTPEDNRLSLWPERMVATDQTHAQRVYRSLGEKISPLASQWVSGGFLTCLEEREVCLWRFIRLGYRRGASITSDLTDTCVHPLHRALRHMSMEVEHLKGFTRFSLRDGTLAGTISPKNRVLPLLRPHFCTRYAGEAFVLYDRTHRQALFHRPGQWVIVPLEDFSLGSPTGEELDYRRLWRRFYDTIAIEGRYNPRLRMNHMPKRFWGDMTEFQREETTPLPPPPAEMGRTHK